ncbi:hypothetical protein [Burkholderia cepacia]|uniref:hypothetical protein n=1 Tax=Burkholderia cepacia TaxID=292 RepID=UPI002AB6E982|nr:hypothetical protein [Burkholderia cepacia]
MLLVASGYTLGPLATWAATVAINQDFCCSFNLIPHKRRVGSRAQCFAKSDLHLLTRQPNDIPQICTLDTYQAKAG